MTDKIATAWNFSITDKNLLSPNKEYRIEYGILNEITMGAPLILNFQRQNSNN